MSRRAGAGWIEDDGLIPEPKPRCKTPGVRWAGPAGRNLPARSRLPPRPARLARRLLLNDPMQSSPREPRALGPNPWRRAGSRVMFLSFLSAAIVIAGVFTVPGHILLVAGLATLANVIGLLFVAPARRDN